MHVSFVLLQCSVVGNDWTTYDQLHSDLMCSSNTLRATSRISHSFLLPCYTTQGVQIVTSEERKVAQVASAIRHAGGGDESSSLIYVYIPCDATRPIEELTYTPESSDKASLLEYLKPSFQSSDAVDLSRMAPGARTLLASGTDAAASLPPVSEATLLQVAQDSHVESFTVVHPDGLNPSLVFYLDEIGALKRRPVNVRASEYAARAGFNPRPTFYGDVYATRINHRTQRNVSCLREDLEQVDAAVLRNLNHQLDLNRRTGQVQAQQPSPAGADGAQCEDGFSWRQTEQDLEVTVALFDPNVTAKHVKVVFRPQELQVSVAANASSAAVSQAPQTLQIRLFERIDVESGTWILETPSEGHRALVMSMEKIEEAFWPRIRD